MAALTVFDWPEAERRALAGKRVRQTDWEEEWLYVSAGVWRIAGPEEVERVVQAADFQAEQFIAQNWTEDPYAADDICARPPPVTDFIPPTLSISAELTAYPTDLVQIRAAIGAGSPGGYRLTYFVNDSRVASALVGAPDSLLQAVDADPAWLTGDIFVEVKIESSLPLPPWSLVARAVISQCPIGGSHNPRAYMAEYGFPTAISGALPKIASGTSLAGLDVVQGADYQLASSGNALFCDMPSYTGPGLPYSGYDGITFHFSNVVRSDFDFSYDYLYTNNASFTGAKNMICVSANSTAWDSPGIHFGTWTDKSWFPYLRLFMVASQAWHLHLLSEEDPPEGGGANLPTAYDTWHTRRLVKRGDLIEYTDGAVGPFRVRRCWFAVRGTVGLIISGGVRVKNLKLLPV